MDKNILDAIIPELETAPEFFVPIKKLWKVLKEKNTVLHRMVATKPFSLEEFTALIREDERFIIQEAKSAPWEDEPEEAAQMEQLGYYTGPRVRLTSRVPTKDDMIRIITHQAQKVIDNLVKAYETRPKDISEEDEGKLIDARVKAKKLKEMIDKTLKDSDSKEK